MHPYKCLCVRVRVVVCGVTHGHLQRPWAARLSTTITRAPSPAPLSCAHSASPPKDEESCRWSVAAARLLCCGVRDSRIVAPLLAPSPLQYRASVMYALPRAHARAATAGCIPLPRLWPKFERYIARGQQAPECVVVRRVPRPKLGHVNRPQEQLVRLCVTRLSDGRCGSPVVPRRRLIRLLERGRLLPLLRVWRRLRLLRHQPPSPTWLPPPQRMMRGGGRAAAGGRRCCLARGRSGARVDSQSLELAGRENLGTILAVGARVGVVRSSRDSSERCGEVPSSSRALAI